MKHIIIGGGLSGLYTAYLLQQRGETDYVVLEAADHFGGRASGLNIDRHQLELGATWFWRDFQPDLARLIDELGLPTFDQPAGKLVYERSAGEPPKVMNYPYVDGQRVDGGMSRLIDALVARLDKEKLYLNLAVQAVNFDGNFGIM